MWYLQHKLIGSYNRDKKCLQLGTDWVFKYSSLRFVFKGLILPDIKSKFGIVDMFVTDDSQTKKQPFICKVKVKVKVKVKQSH